MDFASFNTREGAEEGRFLHLRHLETGDLLWDGEGDARKPVGIVLRGIESKAVLEAINASQRRAAKGGEGDKDMATAQAMVMEFRNIERDGKPLTTSAADLEWFFGLSSGLVRQVVEFASKPGNFLPPASRP